MTASYDPARNYETAPLGIKVYCVIAALASLYLMILSLEIMGAGDPFLTLGFLFFGLAIGHIVVIYGLWMLRPWAWTWGMILFAFDGVLDVLRANGIGVLVSIILIVYLWSKRSLYGK